MRDEHQLLREARLMVLEELVCRVYAIVLANEHDPHRSLIQFSEGLKEQLCRSADKSERNEQALTHAIDRAVELIQTLIIEGQSIPGREDEDEVRS